MVEVATDQEIMDAKAQVDASGIGAEPASCATVAGVKKLVEAGVIGAEEVVCIQEANPTTVTVARGYYSMPGVPTLTITAQQLASGEWVMRR